MNLLDAMRYLAALEQHRHFGRAAQACHITQPALSNALRALEASMGVAIVRRGRQYEGLTVEGERVLDSARRMLHEQELLRQDLASLVGRPQGRLQIGAVPTALPVAVRFAARLRERHPGIQPVVRSLSSQALESGLENLVLDLALGYSDRREVGDRRFQVLPQYTERYFLVERARPPGGSAGHARRAHAPCPWTEAAGRDLVLLTPEMHNRVLIDRALREAGATVEAAIETDSVLALLQPVLDDTAGALVAVLPGALVGTLRSVPGLIVRALVDPVIETSIAWLCVAGDRPSPALSTALELAADADWLAHLGAHTGASSAG
jgi:DNA-binding transcriptional LysR family regulator